MLDERLGVYSPNHFRKRKVFCWFHETIFLEGEPGSLKNRNLLLQGSIFWDELLVSGESKSQNNQRETEIEQLTPLKDLGKMKMSVFSFGKTFLPAWYC